MDNAYQHSTIAQILENILEEYTFEGKSRSDISDILLSILNHTEYNKETDSVIADLLVRLKAKIEGSSFEPYDGASTSRIADIIISILEETEYTEDPQSRIAELLLELKAKLEEYTEVTVSGAIASFVTNMIAPIVSGKFSIVAQQSGVSAIGVSATGKNLYCKTATNTDNGYIDNCLLDTNGEVSSNTSYCISEYIPVRGGENITIQGLIGDRVYVCYYNANKEYIGQGRYSRYTERTYSLPSATAYIRASVPKANLDIFQMQDSHLRYF